MIAVDLNFVTTLDAEVLKQMAVGPEADQIDWHGLMFDDDGMPKATGVKGVSFDRRFEDHVIRIKLGRKVISADEHTMVCKFHASFVAMNAVQLAFQVQMHPKQEEIGALTEGLLRKEVLLTIEKPKQMDIIDD